LCTRHLEQSTPALAAPLGELRPRCRVVPWKDDGKPDDDPSPVSEVCRGRPGYDQATVLRRAIEVFDRQGCDATSMGDLASELGLTKCRTGRFAPYPVRRRRTTTAGWWTVRDYGRPCSAGASNSTQSA
jgi:hypothetical protein